MKENACFRKSAIIRRKERMDIGIENGNFAAALGFRITNVTVEVEIIFKPHCCIKRSKKNKRKLNFQGERGIILIFYPLSVPQSLKLITRL